MSFALGILPVVLLLLGFPIFVVLLVALPFAGVAMATYMEHIAARIVRS